MAADVTPVPSATLLLLRDSPQGPEVLMTTRHKGAVFAGGALVFPGGKVEADDAGLAGSDETLAVSAITAIRETFEETGILLAYGVTPEIHMRAKDALRGGAAFGPLMTELALRPAADRLVRYAHWITPRDRSKRFDAHFFLAEAPSGQEPAVDGREAVDAIWITPERAMAAALERQIKLVFATYMNLSKLCGHGSVAACLEAARSRPVVTVLPEPVEVDGVTMVRLPEAAGYGAQDFRVDAFEPAISKAR